MEDYWTWFLVVVQTWANRGLEVALVEVLWGVLYLASPEDPCFVAVDSFV
jgi:hypothetical protein